MSPTSATPPPLAETRRSSFGRRYQALLVIIGLVIATVAMYAAGLRGGFVFDDYPNIVDNPLVQPAHAGWSELVGAALSSPSSELKRPLASLTFAANFLVSGLDPVAMKVTNLGIHIANGLLLFFLLRGVLEHLKPETASRSTTWAAAAMSLAWLALPINLTAVLYIVQRMESLANLCVLAGLLSYLYFRQRMLRTGGSVAPLAVTLTSFTAFGVGFKETAILLPLYAGALEWIVFCGKKPETARVDRRILFLFLVVLVLPMVAGSALLLPRLVAESAWATRDFSLLTRLLSEARIVLSYIVWSVIPVPALLSFYHDEFRQSVDLWSPWTTLPSIVVVAALLALIPRLRTRRPLIALAIAWYFGCHALTATVIPLELIYEHRNYFASIAVVIALYDAWLGLRGVALRMNRPLRIAVDALPMLWIAACALLTTTTAFAWGDSLRLARELAERSAISPRAQYEYGRALIIASHYKADSPLLDEAAVALEHAAALPGSSILPEQALIFVNSRMKRAVDPRWWDSLYRKLATHPSTVQDDSSILALDSCARDGQCDIPSAEIVRAFELASRDKGGSARLLGAFGQHLWLVANDRERAVDVTTDAVAKAPDEPAYRINLARMLLDLHRTADAQIQIAALEGLNIGGRLDSSLASLRARTDTSPPKTESREIEAGAAKSTSSGPL